MGDKDLPAVQHVSQGDGAVLAPLFEDVHVVNEDDEVLGGTLVEDLGGSVVGTHFGCENWVV